MKPQRQEYLHSPPDSPAIAPGIVVSGRGCVVDTPPELLGQFLLARIGGRVGRMVWLGQAIIGDRSRWTHAALVLDHGQVVEAMPGGAILTPLSEYTRRAEGEVVYSRLRLTPAQKPAVVAAGRSIVGIGYGYPNYLSLGLAHLHVRPAWLTAYIASNQSMICSQAVDECYRLAGVHLFADHRLPGDVTPGDLTRCLTGRIPVR